MNNPKPTPIRTTVMLHGVLRADLFGDQYEEHCDFDSPDCDGWNVWVRYDYETTPTQFEPFDADEQYEGDFQSLHAARIYAIALQEVLGGPSEIEIDEY